MVSAMLTCFIFLSSSLAGTFAQTTSNGFEVASIKPSDPNTQGITFRNMPGRLEINGATLRVLIEQAYDIRDFQISGGPKWIDSDRFDVSAKIEGGANPHPDLTNIPDQRKQMERQRKRLQSLLADRFQLKIRRETKEMQAYVLTTAKNGSKLKEAKLEEPTPVDNKAQLPPRGPGIRVGYGRITGQFITLDFLAQILAQQVGRPVIDTTGLTGSYDFALEWTPDPAQGQGPGMMPAPGLPRPDVQASADAGGTSLFAAIQEQLGLKLDSQKAPVEIIVIENVEKPSEN